MSAGDSKGTMNAGDDLEGFLKIYKERIKEISKRTMEKKMDGNIAEYLLDGKESWMVTDNLEQILTNGRSILQVDEAFEKSILESLLKYYMNKRRYIIFLSDELNRDGDKMHHDHWFSVVCNREGPAYILEYDKEMIKEGDKDEPIRCRKFDDAKSLTSYLIDLMEAREPKDQFCKWNHIFTIWVYDRKPLTAETVMEYLK